MCPANRDRNTWVRSCIMAKQLVAAELWVIIEPLLLPELPNPNGGRPRDPDREVPAGTSHVLKSGIPWEMLPKGLGSVSARAWAGLVSMN